MSQHLLSVHQDYSRLTALRQAAGPGITISGHGLTIPDLVAVSRYHAPCEVSTDAAVRQRVEAAVSFINKAIQPGAKTSIYGVTTGFGASAGLRTNQAQSLQLTFLWGLICGIRPDPDGADDPRTKDFDITWDDSSLVFPEPWAKGSIVLRLNSILRGQSGCSWQLIEKLHSLLVYNITPCPPLRQSISASGDLAPLGYVAATLSDDFNVPVWSGKGKDRKRISSRQARRDHGLGSHTFGPKEALATVNGTGASCAVAALALHDTNILALAAQVTSVMAVEALRGTPENFDFITHDVARPHPGQVEVARNCRALLEGSQLARLHDESDPTQALRQDRYDLRAVPQWIGPQLEELLTSRKTIELEMNCTTDNPILDVEGERGVTGANFMATSVSTVMDKTRIGLNHFGKIAFAQFGQLTNPAMSRGLPVDVAAFEPSLDMGLKIADIAMAAYYSELSFVCNTLTNHVQSAEQHNQSVNSMALASARLTYDAIQILYMIYSTFLVALCQAIDIRGLIARFLERLEAELHRSIAPLFDGKDDVQHAALTKKLFIQSRLYFDQSSAKDSTFRFQDVLRPLVADIVAFQATHKTPSSASFDVTAWHANLAETLGELYRATRLEYFENGSADHLMGRTKVVYLFIRKTLKVPIHKGDHKDAEGWDAKFSRVYRSFESGAIIPVLLEAMQLNDVNGSNGAGTNRTHLAKM